MDERSDMNPDRLKGIVKDSISSYLPDWGLSLKENPVREPQRDPLLWYVPILTCDDRKIVLELIIPPGQPEDLLQKEVYAQLKAVLRSRGKKTQGYYWIRETDEE